MTLRTGLLAISPPHPRAARIALATNARRAFSPTSHSNSRYNPSDFTTQGYSTQAKATSAANSHITPRNLKDFLDRYVVGQDYAKTVIATAVYSQYLRQRLQQEQSEESHPVEDEWPGHNEALPKSQIEKSNVLMLGPTGTGKTLMTKTVARCLNVPYSVSDCTPFTQSGYIGEDAETCVARLLAAANYDVSAAEWGIIVLDEIDKIAGVKVAHGKDIGGEGVQQSLLKIIEGTTLQIQAKPERSNSNTRGSAGMSSNSSSWDRNNPPAPNPMSPSGKGEVFNIRTDNILFICTGAFVGLDKLILSRKAKGGMGFGAQVRSSAGDTGKHETILSDADVASFSKDMPIYIPVETEPTNRGHTGTNNYREEHYNILNYIEPADLQKYGMIPELVGRIPKTCAVSALNEEALVRVLTEPENSLIEQEKRLFLADGIQLHFTSASLREIAAKALKMGTGARGLKAVVERLLLSCKFETPGSSVKYILVTREAAQLKRAPLLFDKGQSQAFETTYKHEEDEWLEELQEKDSVESFSQWRAASAAGG
ncbi:P-loop containing nucleoside triphosphate hydrolase protein [Periconia macrospinosa]|uniref:P-loop containing nucleoside triphosphate hydrolase protein n=1 Tax=Periconia macrospinosa TaxID=97972 RepID=A0A2V1DQR3_9PLEO|nr:P-loop containing nucleoside triphosphate hydrolase protein [Periconia macrospinosa]